MATWPVDQMYLPNLSCLTNEFSSISRYTEMSDQNVSKQGSKGQEDESEENYTPETFKVLLKKLVQSPTEFTPEDCELCFRHLCVEGASNAQVGASDP